MTGDVAWWEGLPGMDWRYLPPDPVFGDRATSVACACRVWGVVSGTVSREVENTADRFFAWIQQAKSQWDSYVRRLSLAMACASPTTTRNLVNDLIKHAEWFHRYLTKEASSHGGWV